jgi:hypothetical protein
VTDRVEQSGVFDLREVGAVRMPGVTVIRTLDDAHAYFVVGLGWPQVPWWMRTQLTRGRLELTQAAALLSDIDKTDPWGVQQRAREPRSPLDDIRDHVAKVRYP